MHRFRTLALAVGTVALVLTAFAAPATAAFGKGSIAVVNGRPGPRLDFCIGSVKVKRNVPYGGKYFRQLNQGNKILRAYIANGRARCGGTKVAQLPFALADGGDLTFVITRKVPRVVVYDNVGLGSVQQTGPRVTGVSIMAFRTASDLAGVNVYLRYWVPIPDTPIAPTAFPVWTKGDGWPTSTPPGYEWQARATFPEKLRSIAVARRQAIPEGRRLEWIFVGSNGRNARWVKLNRAIYQLPL